MEILDNNPDINDFAPVDVNAINLDEFNPVFVKDTGGNYPEEGE